MSVLEQTFRLLFPADYDAQSEFETPSRGYLSDVDVLMEDGSRYRLFFIDPVRLQQELNSEVESHRCYFAEPNLIVLPRVSTETIKTAVEGLVRDSFFQNLKPL